jgi:GEVED domain/Secretion system C-terminal sorting domain
MRSIAHHALFAFLITASLTHPLAVRSSYCIPVHGGQIVAPIITSVSLGTISNTGTNVPLVASGYSDFTAQQTTLVVGTSHTLTIGSDDAWPHNFAAWVDMDHDMHFSDAERIGLALMIPGSYTLSFNFTIPVEALNGPTRLRIRGVEEPFGPWNLSNDPCIPFTYGEVEDYTVVITGGGTNDAALAELISPVSAVGLGVEPVLVRIVNRGTSVINALQVQLSIDGVAGPVENVTAPLAPGTGLDHTFQTTVDHSGLDCHELSIALLTPDDRPENNNLIMEACDLDPVIGSDVWYIHSNQFQPIETYDSGTTNETTMNTVFGAGAWDLGYFETLDVAQVFGPGTCTIFIDGSFLDVDPMMDFLEAHGTTVERWVASGGKLFLNSSPDSQDFLGHVRLDLGFGGVSLAQGYVVSYGQPYGTHPVHTGPFQPIGNEWTGFYYANAVLQGAGLTKVNVENNDAHFNGPEVDLPTLAEMEWGAGKVLFGTIGPSELFGAEAMNDRANILSYITDCSVTTGVNVEATEQVPVAYPNPTNGTLHILLSRQQKVLSIEVHDLLGSAIHPPVTRQGDEVRIDAEACASGIYVATLTMADHTLQYIRFVRE